MNAKCIKGRCQCQGGLMGNGRTKCFRKFFLYVYTFSYSTTITH